MAAILAFSVALLAAVLLSSLAQRSVLSVAVMFLAAGFVCGPSVLDVVHADGALTQEFAELALVAVLFADGMHLAGSKLRAAWRLPGRALLIGLPFTLVMYAVFAHAIAGLSWPSAWLIGGALSPTDPVFAAAIIGADAVPPRLRHLLNVESGLNDGLALPIVMGMLAVRGASSTPALAAAGDAALGVAIGAAVPWLVVRLVRMSWLFEVTDQYAPIGAVAVALFVFSACRLLHANEFLGAFAAGTVLARMAPRAKDGFLPFGEPVAEMLKLAALLLFGALLTVPPFLNLNAGAYVFAALALFVARPVALGLALIGSDLTRREKLVAGWFGPKGFASVFFAFLILRSGVADSETIFYLIALVITASIVAHSSTDVLVARWFGSAPAEPATRESPRPRHDRMRPAARGGRP